jgi:biotin-dependent carboxylase-like uncharacterized protein
MNGLKIVAPGTFASIQDLGRPGWRHLGVPHAGASDRGSLRLANRLVGNREDKAGIESLMGGLTIRFESAATVALTGAPVSAKMDGGPWIAMNAAHYLPAGATLSLSRPHKGLRTYVAVAGGIDVEPTLGSRSSDTLSKLGPEPLSAGALLPVGKDWTQPPAVDVVPPPDLPGDVIVPFDVGPREDKFVPCALDTLTAGAYVVTPDISRVGLKLDGPRLVRADETEMRSEGVVPGAIEVPPSGRPILLLADCPTVGGYPVIGVVCDSVLDGLSQLRPGATIRFSRRDERSKGAR